MRIYPLPQTKEDSRACKAMGLLCILGSVGHIEENPGSRFKV